MSDSPVATPYPDDGVKIDVRVDPINKRIEMMVSPPAEKLSFVYSEAVSLAAAILGLAQRLYYDVLVPEAETIKKLQRQGGAPSQSVPDRTTPVGQTTILGASPTGTSQREGEDHV